MASLCLFRSSSTLEDRKKHKEAMDRGYYDRDWNSANWILVLVFDIRSFFTAPALLLIIFRITRTHSDYFKSYHSGYFIYIYTYIYIYIYTEAELVPWRTVESRMSNTHTCIQFSDWFYLAFMPLWLVPY
jgi:hypothetical protein